MYPRLLINNACDYLLDQNVNLESTRIFITGGTGYVGSWVLTVLNEYQKVARTKFQVIALTRDINKARIKYGNLNYLDLNWIEGSSATLRLLQIDSTHVIHAATPTTIATGSLDYKNVQNSSVETLKSVIALARKSSKTPRVLHTSSGAVYRNAISDPDFNPPRDFDINSNLYHSRKHAEYTRTKIETENLVSAATKDGLISGINARLFSFYGPGIPIDGSFAIGRFMDDALKKERIEIEGSGQAIRSYLAGHDLAAQIIYLLMSDLNLPVNISGPTARRMNEWAELIANIVPSEIHVAKNIQDDDDIYCCSKDELIPSNKEQMSDMEIFKIWREYLLVNN